jgi:hypothetical protein
MIHIGGEAGTAIEPTFPLKPWWATWGSLSGVSGGQQRLVGRG